MEVYKVIIILLPLTLSNKINYPQLWKDIAEILKDQNYESGSYGPIVIRLAWHASGTYDKNDGSGGSNGATMRFPPESDYDANRGLKVARDRLEPIKEKYPNLSYGDLWTLAAVVAFWELEGPKIPWAPGRIDAVDGSNCPPDNQLPNATYFPPGQPTIDHIRDKFGRMGFNDSEIVALMGAHTIGRMHKEVSGFDGVWTSSQRRFSKRFYRYVTRPLIKKKTGPLAYFDPSGHVTMLTTDVAMVQDPSFLFYVEKFKVKHDYFIAFPAAFSKLLHLGVPAPKPDPENWWKNLVTEKTETTDEPKETLEVKIESDAKYDRNHRANIKDEL